jgi:hypothetical protein
VKHTIAFSQAEQLRAPGSKGLARDLVTTKAVAYAVAATWILLGPGSIERAHGASRDQALKIYNRVAGVPPSDSELAQMTALIQAGDYKAAARIATSSFHFYNTNLVRWAHFLSNREETNRPKEGESNAVPLNDYVATIVGMVRDSEQPGQGFDQVLYGDVIYTGATGLANVAAFAFNSNTHYLNLGDQISPANGGLDLSKTTTLVRQSQTALRPAIPDVAGVLTTRQAGLEFFSAGTNRRPLRYALKEFMCVDPAQISDTTVPDTYVRRDVDRAPSGNSQVYLTSCKGCHAGLDGLAGAFSFFDFSNNALAYTANQVPNKITNSANVVFAQGRAVTNDSWVNQWMDGQNAKLGWKQDSSSRSGIGVNSLGRALAGSQQFASCMAKRAFELGCVREPGDADAADIRALANAFVGGGYKMKALFEDAAILQQCRGN